MADVGKVNGKMAPAFPLKRRGTDPLQPESTEIQFSQELAQHDLLVSETVQAAEMAESMVIRDQSRGRQPGQQGEKRERNEEGEQDETGEEPIVDLEV